MDQQQPSTQSQKPIYVIGDIHGHYDQLVHLLRHAELIDRDLAWCGENTVLCCIGDYVDRGPHGIDCINLVMRLQKEAAQDGGEVTALLGNHDVLLLAVYLFCRNLSFHDDDMFMRGWRENGGIESDLLQMQPHHAEWLANLPAMALIGGRLCFHADAMFYPTYGDTIEEINEPFQEILGNNLQRIWIRLINEFAQRHAFSKSLPVGKERAALLLETYGGKSIIHGHTPISNVVDISPNKITGPLVYADSLCMNVDGGLGHRGPGFIYKFKK